MNIGGMRVLSREKRNGMEPYVRFIEAEEKNIESTKKHFDKEIGIYIECFNLLAQTIDHIAEQSINWEPPFQLTETVILANTTRILNSMRTYIDLVMKGYYFDARIVHRSLYENVLLIDCFTRDRKYVDKWMAKELKLSEVKRELGLYSEEKLEKFYEEMCDYVHANVPAILTVVDLRGEVDRIDLLTKPQFDLKQTPVDVVFPLIGYMTLGLLHNFFGNVMKPNFKSKIREALTRWKIDAEQLLENQDRKKEKPKRVRKG